MPRPLPTSSASIYSFDGLIWVQFPTSKGRTAEVSFQPTPAGFAALHRFLREREIASAGAHTPNYATPAVPIQHIVNSWQRDPAAEAKAQKAAERAERERFKSKPAKEQLEELRKMFEQDFGV